MTPLFTLTCAGIGLVSSLLTSAMVNRVFGPEYPEVPTLPLTLGVTGGLAVVGLILDISLINEEEPSPENVEKNKKLSEDWESQIRQVNRYNDSLLTEANNRIREENQKIIDENKTRMVWTVKCVTDNTETTIELK